MTVTSTGSPQSRAGVRRRKGGWGPALAASAAVLVVALLLRVFPIESESLHWDSVSYVRASRQGFVANWVDQGHPGLANFGKIWDFNLDYGKSVIRRGVDTLWLRHFHPPMLAYILRVQELLLGYGDFRVRLCSMVCGALNSALLVLALVSIRGHSRLAVAAGVGSGLLLAATPYHLFVSRTASYHALFPLVASLFLFGLATALWTERNTWFTVSVALLAVAFATFEWAILLLAVFGIALLAIRNPWVGISKDLRLSVSGQATKAAIGGLILFALLWPAGIIKADWLQALLHHTLYGRAHAPDRQWWQFYAMFYRSAPTLAILEALGFGYIAVRAAVRRIRRGTLVWLLFGLAFAALTPFQRLLYAHYVAPLFPVAALFAGLLAHDAGKLLGRRLGVVAALLLVGIASGTAVQKWDHPVADPQEVPGFSQAATFFRDHADPESSILSTAAPLLRFYLPEYDIRSIPYEDMPASTLARAQSHRYRFVLIYRNQLDNVRGFKQGEAYRWIKDNLDLARTIRHLRRGFPCVWIYEDFLYRRPSRIEISPALFRTLETRSATDLWHIPFDELPFNEENVVQLYLDGNLMRNGGGSPYRGWDQFCYWRHIYKPEIGLVVGVPHGQGTAWFRRHRYEAAVWPEPAKIGPRDRG